MTETGNIIEKKVDDNELFDTTGLILDYMSHWKWFVISVIAVLIGAYFFIATIVPTYEVKASIYLKSNTADGANPLSFNPDNPLVAMKSYIDETELEVLKSRNNVINIVDSLKMAYSYWKEGPLRDEPLYEENTIIASLDSVSLRHLDKPIEIVVSNGDEDGKYDISVSTTFKNVDEEKSFDNVSMPFEFELSRGTVTLTRSSQFPNLEGTEKIYIRNPLTVAGNLSKALNIEFADKAPTIVRISYFTSMPTEGEDVINTLVDFYNRQIIEDQNRSALQTESFIIDRLVNINGELRDVEQRLQEYRQAHNISDLEQQVRTSIATQTSTEGQLAEVEAQMRIVELIEAAVEKADVYESLPSVSSDVTLNAILEAYNKKVAQLNRMLESSTQESPLVKTMQEDLQRDKKRIMQNVLSVKSGLIARRNNIAAIENRSTGQLAALPPVDKGLQEIFREQQVKVNIYTFLLQKREEIALQKTLATPSARLIDDPMSEQPVSPRRLLIYFVALLLGLAIPAVIIFLRRLIFPVFKDQEELQRQTNIPIIGEISISNDKDSENGIVVGQNVSTQSAELFRLLRNNIGFTKNGADKKVILVTSSISGEGKTFVSTNLAMTYALTGKKVVVVGMDIRRPVLAYRFKLTNRQGVTTFLSGQTNDLDSLIHQSTQNPNLYILPAGPVPPNPNELLLSDNMDRLMKALREKFDYVIIDSAPIGVISDTFLIVRHTDIQLYVARASYSTKSCLKTLHQAMSDNRLSDPYIVLNGVNMSTGSYTYRKYGHYYVSGHTKNRPYGYGYSHDDKEKKSKDKE